MQTFQSDLNEAENSISEPLTLYACPECNDSFQIENGILYTHLINAHGIAAWLKFRNEVQIQIKVYQKYQNLKIGRGVKVGT